MRSSLRNEKLRNCRSVWNMLNGTRLLKVCDERAPEAVLSSQHSVYVASRFTKYTRAPFVKYCEGERKERGNSEVLEGHAP